MSLTSQKSNIKLNTTTACFQGLVMTRIRVTSATIKHSSKLLSHVSSFFYCTHSVKITPFLNANVISRFTSVGHKMRFVFISMTFKGQHFLLSYYFYTGYIYFILECKTTYVILRYEQQFILAYIDNIAGNFVI
jgi:hypothetical protein